MFEFGRDVCGDLINSERREWLVTNGLGGFASGTVAGMLTRRYHGLLFAPLQPPIARMLLVSKLDETAVYGDITYPLFINRWAGGVLEPIGQQQLERFRLSGTIPVWTYAIADALLEKRIWMEQGANTTYVQYHLLRATEPLELSAKALVNYRNAEANTHANDWEIKIDSVEKGLKITAYQGAVAYYLFSDKADIAPKHYWNRRFFLMKEANRGFDAIDDHLHAADVQVVLEAGEKVTFVFSTETNPLLDGNLALQQRKTYEKSLVERAPTPCSDPIYEPITRQLILAADQFVVKRPLPSKPLVRSILAGYHWFNDWSRDSMVSLPGLLLATGRIQAAREILYTYASFIDEGMLPNRFPNGADQAEYHAVDATLWYFEALRAYVAASNDHTIVQELFPVLQDIIAWYQRGTRFNIKADEADGLLYGGQTGHCLTWMNAKHGDWVVTPRIGKPVEVNALWYNAISIMTQFACELGYEKPNYFEMANNVKEGFQRFWNQEMGYLYDVLDSPDENGQPHNDSSLRPNQLLAVSLPYSPLNAAQQRDVVEICSRHLLTSHGLRSLATEDPNYIGVYGGDEWQRASAYHQGTVWSWLMGPFITAHLRVYQDPEQTRSFLIPLLHHMADYGVGSVSDIFDGDPPFTPRGCIAKAWSVGELVRACRETAVITQEPTIE